ncbi:MAG: hypothetical protein ABSG80_07095 [Verrucomicrobiota bacterium]
MTKVLFISILASLGAAAVAWGLFLESFKGKPEFRDIEDFRSSEQKSHCGQKWVFWGVIAEMILGFGIVIWEGADMIKTDRKIEEADTRNLPIDSIAGYARVEIKPQGDREMQFVRNLHQVSANSEPIFSPAQMQKGETAILYLAKHPMNDPGAVEMGVVAQVVFVGTVLGEGIGVRKSLPYVPNICFDLSFNSQQSGVWNLNDVTFNELNFVQIVGVGRDEVLTPMVVIGGEIDLKLGLWRKTFLIPPQTNQFWRVSSFKTNGAFVPAGYGLVTNSVPAR